jgi:hypothetical protein
MNAETLGTVHTFSENLFALSISDTEIGGWRNTSSRQPEFVIRRPDEPGRVIALSNYRSNKVAFVSEDMIAIESGYSPMPLVRTDGTLKESITPRTHEFFSRVTPSVEGHRFAFTGSRIRTSEILDPHQTWEYVQRIYIYDMTTHSFVCDVKVKHSARKQDFPLALSPNGSRLAPSTARVLRFTSFPQRRRIIRRKRLSSDELSDKCSTSATNRELETNSPCTTQAGPLTRFFVP